MSNFDGNKEERLAVFISGAPNYTEGVVIGIPILSDKNDNPTSTGEAQYSAVVKLLQEWNVKDDIVAMTFDTTSSNTGRHKGACTRLEKTILEEKYSGFLVDIM